MKTATQELIDLLHGSETFYMADLITITLKTGESLRYTDADAPVYWQGKTFEAHGAIVARGAVRVTTGLEVDSNDLTVAADASHRLQGLPFVEAAVGGALDGALVLIERAFFADWTKPPTGTVVVFSGRVSDVSGSRHSVKITVKSDIELLNTKMPRNLYQPSCLRTVYDEGCGANKAAFTVAGSVTENNGTGTWLKSGLSQKSGWFDQGVLTFLSGKNIGLTRTVKAYANGQFWFALKLPYPPAVGDTFRVYPGCDKRQATCGGKFNNIVHFRGYPYIPAAETVA
ncbi:MAG: DUF2163 domain-containing protein [Neisseria sp.]|nr:DUF2163 domain-containing protein [Neisseria sp.]